MTANANFRVKRPTIRRQIFLVALGVSLLLVVLLLIYGVSDRGGVKDRDYVGILDERVALLEKQVADLSAAVEGLKGLDSPGSRLEGLNTSCQRLEASLTLKSNLLAERINTLETLVREEKNRRTETPPKKNVAAPFVPTPAQVPPKQSVKASPRYHVVEKGDTFYSISRRYGMTLKRLRELNHFNEKTIIYPGQKVIVSP
ncbi:hypothetical protein JCM14469_18000 [Desulfatiferula olefinivorans]